VVECYKKQEQCDDIANYVDADGYEIGRLKTVRQRIVADELHDAENRRA